MKRPFRAVCTAPALASCFALAACGDDDVPADIEPAPANAGAASGLGVERFRSDCAQ